MSRAEYEVRFALAASLRLPLLIAAAVKHRTHGVARTHNLQCRPSSLRSVGAQAFLEWQRGEPAFVKYWVESDATSRSGKALRVEEGTAQDFVHLTLAAFLATRQVMAYRFSRIPLYLHDEVASEQFSIRRADLGALPAVAVDDIPDGESPPFEDLWRPPSLQQS